MFLEFFFELREIAIPVTLREFLTFLGAVDAGAAEFSIEGFYYLARSTLIKDQRHYDRFDLVFARVFRGIAASDDERVEIPEEWLRRLAEKHLTPEDMAQIQALGDWDELMRTLRERLREQQSRHQGGSKWIGTAGTSPFGAYGFSPMGVRIGQDRSRHRRAVKVWDRREFQNLDGDVELGTRTMKMALRRLRRLVREGADEELDLDATIRATADNTGQLDLVLRPERRNRVKVLLLLDVGGSMDDHVRIVEELFSACRAEFKHLERFYFHNCVYESVWRDNARRHTHRVPTWDVLRTYASDYKLFIVGDASMSPYEIIYPGGAIEHRNEEPGQLWLTRLTQQYPDTVWINPVPREYWQWTESIAMVDRIVDGRMYPLTLSGLEQAISILQ